MSGLTKSNIFPTRASVWGGVKGVRWCPRLIKLTGVLINAEDQTPIIMNNILNMRGAAESGLIYNIHYALLQ